jgi:hypothetical protein
MLGPERPASEIENPGPPLKTVPVGEPGPKELEGTLTRRGMRRALPSRRSDEPLPFSLNQKGPVGLKEIPHGLTR